MRTRTLGRLIVVATLIAVGHAALADGILIPPLRPDVPYFTIKYHHVKVEIEDQIATTHVDQVFVNNTRRQQEATYIFPLPLGAVVKEFTLIVDGEKLEGELLPRDKAVKIYEDIVRQRRDPALLEYTGRGMYKARIFPIPARGERRIEIRYTELLNYDNGMVAYNYPMSTEKFSAEPIKETVFEAKITSKAKLGAVYSPSHDIDVARKGKNECVVSYEEKNSKPDRDMLLYYAVAEDEVGTSVLPFKEKGEDGFFLLLAAPTQGDLRPGKAPAKNVIFVLDRSGSMRADGKIDQARSALKFCVESLNPQDKFDIITFASGITSFGEGLIAADREAITRSRKFINEIEARGGTDINGALSLALETRAKGSPNYIAFLTDGLPTVGDITNPDEIAKLITKCAAEAEDTSSRLFAFGVGYDVDIHFLDKLSQDNRGVSTYVRPEEDIEVKVSNWYSKIAQPVLTDLALDFGTVTTYDSFPRTLPDLFSGSQLAVFGRYKDDTAGATAVTLSGKTSEGKRSFSSDATFPKVREGTDYVASLWAARKIGYLLDQIRLHGKEKELVDEVIALSTKYGILTEYTAFLAEEDEAVPRVAAAERAVGSMGGAFARRTGGWATSQTVNAQRMKSASNVTAQNSFFDAEGNEVWIANIQNRGQRGFVLRGKQWQDLRYKPDEHKVDLQVQAYSEAYFQLSRAFPAVNQFLAVSDDMILMVNGRAVQIGSEGKTRLSNEELKALAADGEGKLKDPAATGALPASNKTATAWQHHSGLLAGPLAATRLRQLAPKIARSPGHIPGLFRACDRAQLPA